MLHLIGVPFDGNGRSDHQASAAAVLREAGILAAFPPGSVQVQEELSLPLATPQRAEGSGIRNEPALLAMTDALYTRIGQALTENRFPLIYGADCSVLLGAVPALGSVTGQAGLLFVDAHEDTTPLDVSNGEGATMEMGLLLGITGQLAPKALKKYLPALSHETVVMLGMRDYALRHQANVASLANRGVAVYSHQDVAKGPAQLAHKAVTRLQATTAHWWLHIDLDVLAQDVFTAQRVPDDLDESGGLTWEELTQLVTNALQTGGCRGCSIVIYDPQQDPQRTEAKRIVQFIREIAPYLPIGS